MSNETAAPARPPGAAGVALRLWAQAYRVELTLFALSFAVLAMFSSQRFLRQSAAPHFVYQAQAWLDGRIDVDMEVIRQIAPGYAPEDWACVRDVGGVKQRCTQPLQPTDRWYSSFPAFPAVAMLPFVVLHSYQFNDTSFGVILAALAIALFYSLLRLFQEQEGTPRTPADNVALALLLGFGTLFFYCSLRGEVWFLAEVMGVALTALYVRNAVGARRPVLAGVFWSMAVLTRAPLLLTGLFFVLEAVCPTKGQRLEELKKFARDPKVPMDKLWRFALGAAPVGLAGALFNWARFGSVAEFGHRFFFDNRVNQDIDTWGLFSLQYLQRNLDAAFLKLPAFAQGLRYDPWGLSLFLTLPVLALVFVPPSKAKQAFVILGAMAATLLLSAMGSGLVWLALTFTLGLMAYSAWEWTKQPDAPRLLGPLLLTLAACAVPGLFYQNTGYAQFGFRFSLDYTPYVVMLLAVGGWQLRKPLPMALGALALAVNFWGAVAFRGYTELVRHWQ